jgi:hypothetical protein
MGFLYMGFVMFRYALSIPNFFRDFFIMMGCWILPDFFCVYWVDHMVIIFHSVDMAYHAYFFLHMLSHLFIPEMSST